MGSMPEWLPLSRRVWEWSSKKFIPMEKGIAPKFTHQISVSMNTMTTASKNFVGVNRNDQISSVRGRNSWSFTSRILLLGILRQNTSAGRMNATMGLIHCCNFFAWEICQPLQLLLHQVYDDITSGAPPRFPLNVAVQGNWPSLIAERKDAGVVPGARKDVLMIERLPCWVSNEELTARRQQWVRFMPPSCRGRRVGGESVRLVSAGIASGRFAKPLTSTGRATTALMYHIVNKIFATSHRNSFSTSTEILYSSCTFVLDEAVSAHRLGSCLDSDA